MSDAGRLGPGVGIRLKTLKWRNDRLKLKNQKIKQHSFESIPLTPPNTGTVESITFAHKSQIF